MEFSFEVHKNLSEELSHISREDIRKLLDVVLKTIQEVTTRGEPVDFSGYMRLNPRVSNIGDMKKKNNVIPVCRIFLKLSKKWRAEMRKNVKSWQIVAKENNGGKVRLRAGSGEQSGEDSGGENGVSNLWGKTDRTSPNMSDPWLNTVRERYGEEARSKTEQLMEESVKESDSE